MSRWVPSCALGEGTHCASSGCYERHNSWMNPQATALLRPLPLSAHQFPTYSLSRLCPCFLPPQLLELAPPTPSTTTSMHSLPPHMNLHRSPPHLCRCCLIFEALLEAVVADASPATHIAPVVTNPTARPHSAAVPSPSNVSHSCDMQQRCPPRLRPHRQCWKSWELTPMLLLIYWQRRMLPQAMAECCELMEKVLPRATTGFCEPTETIL
jgi:hypothetical protein